MYLDMMMAYQFVFQSIFNNGRRKVSLSRSIHLTTEMGMVLYGWLVGHTKTLGTKYNRYWKHYWVAHWVGLVPYHRQRSIILSLI